MCAKQENTRWISLDFPKAQDQGSLLCGTLGFACAFQQKVSGVPVVAGGGGACLIYECCWLLVAV